MAYFPICTTIMKLSSTSSTGIAFQREGKNENLFYATEFRMAALSSYYWQNYPFSLYYPVGPQLIDLQLLSVSFHYELFTHNGCLCP